jgi:drug/metabolite transporter (DMT)-like permease
MSQALALAGAFFYGLADFAGGYATRRLSVWTVTAWSQLLGVALLVVGLAVVPVTEVTARDLLFGSLAGLAGLFGLVLLYLALARGSMAVVAPISGAVAAAIPVLVDVVFGPGLSSRQWLGVGLALSAVLLVGFEHTAARVEPRIIGGAVLAGIGFGLFFLALAQTDAASGLWPLVAARATSVPIAFAIAAFHGVAAPPLGRGLALVAVVGTLDMAANIAIATALQRGPAGVIAVLSSLYPAVTAAAAVVLLRERPSSRQFAGIALAMGAMVVLVGG